MTSHEYTKNNNASVVDNVKKLAQTLNTSKADIATILGVSIRTVDNRFSENIKITFTIAELLKLSFFWGIPLKYIISPRPSTIEDLLKYIDAEHTTMMNLLKRQIKKKGETL